MRFIAGTTPFGPPPHQPVGARTVTELGPWPAWACDHDVGEITSCSSPRGYLVRAGTCLATPVERSEALDAASRGDLARAGALPGSGLTGVFTGDGVLVGDRAGAVTVFWTRHAGRVWWSTSALALAGLTGAGPDAGALLSRLALTGVEVGERSAFPGIHRVPPGSALRLLADRAPMLRPVPEPAALSFEDGAGLLRAALLRAVGGRVERGDLSTDLSGGVDSGCVTALAARTAAGPLPALTYTDQALADSDDVRYARRLAAENRRLDHHLVDGRASGAAHFDLLQDIAALPATDTPALALGLLAIKDAQFAPARAAGARHHLTGRGGDNVFGAAPQYLADLWRDGPRTAATTRTTDYARGRTASARAVRRQARTTAGTSYPHALHRASADLRAGHRPPAPCPAADLAWCGTSPAAPWLTPAGRALAADVLTDAAHRADPTAAPGRTHDRLGLEFMATSHAAYQQIARQRWGLTVHAPLLDPAVVGAAMAIPARDRVAPGLYKPLAARALQGLVPDWLLHRRTKTSFSASLYRGLARNHPTLAGVLDASRLGAAGLIETRAVAAQLAAAAGGAPAPLGALHALVVTELWLTRTADRPVRWTTTRGSTP
ncbi:asparagine synthase-related protein [Streptomyces spiramenti]|uniref:Asparagine synthetase domain-containing protein n=1 Tax=Streptomyces spiramenti TaxID=2720606 RepID=A0ABX1APC3_9ACTN|nr:asparagine synthase-related protein [Streptomyces spiramenti]NJP66317.1 hypothetical protein [Streptomyces spiramenti]